jgi:hypothetical protein
MVEQNKSERAIADLGQKLEELTELLRKEIYKNTYEFNYKFLKLKKETEYVLSQNFSENSKELRDFEEVSNVSNWDRVKGTPTQLSDRRRKIMLRSAGAIGAIISRIEKFSLPEMKEALVLPKVFIAHGGKTKALDKVQSFLDVLGIDPLIAEEEPSEDRSVNEQVEWCLNNSDCGIILGTADDKDLKDGKLYPRRNVHIEIGRVQERFPDKVIYLLEEGAAFPSNISEKVYERFTQENMEKAFLKIAKELRAFGIIRAETIRKQSVQNL